MSDPKTYEALYYPFIHFRDEQWIKAMSLYWDGFSRIVPRGYRTHDGDDIRAFVDGGVVSNVEPSPKVRDAAAVTFGSILDSYEDEIVRRFSLDDIDSWATDHVTSSWAGPQADARLAYMHVDKIEWHFGQQLQRLGVASPARGGDDRWVGMHPRLVDAYMVTFADLLAVETAAHPLTDDFDAHCAVAVGGGIDKERLATALFGVEPATRAPRDAEEVLVALAFDSLLPDFREVPVDVVLEVRRTTIEERADFQAGVANLIDPARFEGASFEAVAREMERIYEKCILPKLSALEEAMRRVNVNVLTNAASIKTGMAGVPGLAAAFADGPLAWIAGGFAVAIGAAHVYSTARADRQRVRQDNPIPAYLFTLQKALPPRKLVELAVQ